jgi:transcriptional regulator with XRE-family HTH domain
VKVNDVLEALRLEFARQRVTQRELERQFGWGHSYLSSVLSGRTDLKVKTLFKVLDALKIHPADFLAKADSESESASYVEEDEEERLLEKEELERLFELLQRAGRVAGRLSPPKDRDRPLRPSLKRRSRG